VAYFCEEASAAQLRIKEGCITVSTGIGSHAIEWYLCHGKYKLIDRTTMNKNKDYSF